MTKELQADFVTGDTLYGLLRNAIGQFWRTDTSVWETYSSANFSHYTITMTEAGASGIYLGNMPSVVGGQYTAAYKLQAGGSPAESDTTVADQDLGWNGTAVITWAQLAAGVAHGDQGSLDTSCTFATTDSSVAFGIGYYGIYSLGADAGAYFANNSLSYAVSLGDSVHSCGASIFNTANGFTNTSNILLAADGYAAAFNNVTSGTPSSLHLADLYSGINAVGGTYGAIFTNGADGSELHIAGGGYGINSVGTTGDINLGGTGTLRGDLLGNVIGVGNGLGPSGIDFGGVGVEANVTQWDSEAVPTPVTAGVPEVRLAAGVAHGDTGGSDTSCTFAAHGSSVSFCDSAGNAFKVMGPSGALTVLGPAYADVGAYFGDSSGQYFTSFGDGGNFAAASFFNGNSTNSLLICDSNGNSFNALGSGGGSMVFGSSTGEAFLASGDSTAPTFSVRQASGSGIAAAFINSASGGEVFLGDTFGNAASFIGNSDIPGAADIVLGGTGTLFGDLLGNIIGAGNGLGPSGMNFGGIGVEANIEEWFGGSAPAFSTPTDITNAVTAIEAHGDANWPTATGFATSGQASTIISDIGALPTVAQIWAETRAALTGVPAISASILDKLEWIFELAANQVEQTANLTTLQNAANNAPLSTAAVSDNGTTFVRAPWH